MSVAESATLDDDPLLASVLMRVRPLLMEFEGFRPRPYLCQAHKWTIGYGSTFYLDGRAVSPADAQITQQAAWRLAMLTIERVFYPAVRAACPRVTNPRRLAVLVSFCYNFGPGALRTSTMRKRINADDWAGAAKELLRWNLASGRVSPGLVRRRRVEASMLLHPMIG